MTLVEQQDTYERYVVPESRRVPAEALIAKIDFNKPRPHCYLLQAEQIISSPHR